MTSSTTRIAVAAVALVLSACGDDGTGTGGADATSASAGASTRSSGTGQPSSGSTESSGGGSPSSSSTDAISTGEGAGGAGQGGAGPGGGPGTGGDEPGTCTDEARNNHESDVDCGGPCPGCGPNLACSEDADCTSAASCEEGTCKIDPVGVWEEITSIPDSLIAQPYGLRDEAMFYDSVLERTVIFGGNSYGPFIHDFTALYDGEEWVDAEPDESPPPRALASAAYMTNRGRGVLFGGDTGGDVPVDTWEWISDDNTWELADDGSGVHPPPRRDAAMAYDPRREVVVLFGGHNGTPLHDTWEWDGATWTEVDVDVPPPGRWLHGAAYLDAIESVVVFGGRGTTPDDRFADTWGFDGTTWTKLAGALDPGPGALSEIRAVAWDSHRDKVVLFGGNYVDVFAQPLTWELDADGWRRIETPLGTTLPTYASPMVYDEARARMVMVRATEDTRRTIELYMLGNACDGAGDCGSGHCADGVCCDTDCAAGECGTLDNPGICQ